MTAALVAGTICAATAAIAEQHSDINGAIGSLEAALNGGDAAAAAAVYTEDAILLPPDAPRIDGREGIAGFWGAMFEAGVGDVVLETAELDMLGDTAIETGTWQVSVPDGNGGTVTPSGKYIVVWKRGADGGWMAQQDIWNDNPAPE